MSKGLKKVLVMTALTAAMAFTVSGCGLREPTDADRAQKVIDAYQEGDVKTFKSYVKEDARMHYLLDALEESNVDGMVQVYQKVYELTKNAEYTFVEENKKENDDGYATVTIKTVDFTDAMEEAMEEAIAEGGEAFADVPTWMMKALNTGGEPVEKEVKVRVHENNTLYNSFNDEFLEVLTGGFYDYIMVTMTTCTADNEYKDVTYMLSDGDNVIASLDEYVISFEGMEVADEDIQTVIDEYCQEYDGYDGIAAGGSRIEDGIKLYLFINYDLASTFTLQRLNLITSGFGDGISLKTSISNLEGDGYICETTDFGSGVSSN